MKRFPLLVAILEVVLSVNGALAQSALTALTQNGAAEIHTILQRAARQGMAPGVVAMVASKDGVLYEGSFG